VEAEVLADGAPLAGFSHDVLNRVPLTPALAEEIAHAEGAGARVLFDVDDLIFDPEVVAGLDFVRASADPGRIVGAAEGIGATVRRLGAGLCATEPLRRELEARGVRALVALNGVSDEMVSLSRRARAERPADGAFRIGFAGGHPGHAFNLTVAEEALESVLRKHPRARAVFIGPVAPPARLAPLADRVEHRPSVGWRRLPFELARLDAFMAPLADHAFNRGKSDIKLLEAALVGVPVVASPVGQLGETIRPGTNGLLARGTQGWAEALGSLAADRGLGARLAAAAAEEVLAGRTSAALGPALVRRLEELSGG
jgi:glycosyltransferase involved in cell wall biosynthesis